MRESTISKEMEMDLRLKGEHDELNWFDLQETKIWICLYFPLIYSRM